MSGFGGGFFSACPCQQRAACCSSAALQPPAASRQAYIVYAALSCDKIRTLFRSISWQFSKTRSRLRSAACTVRTIPSMQHRWASKLHLVKRIVATISARTVFIVVKRSLRPRTTKRFRGLREFVVGAHRVKFRCVRRIVTSVTSVMFISGGQCGAHGTFGASASGAPRQCRYPGPSGTHLCLNTSTAHA